MTDKITDKPAWPLTSILIPAYNCAELTEACLRSVFENTLAPYEIILVDDASQPPLMEQVPAANDPRVRVIRNETRQSFSRNNNLAAKSARGKYLCLLNNDTLVEPGWLQSMVVVMEREADVGALGNKHLFPSTKLLHHCGMAADDKGYPWHLHPHTDPALPAVNYQRDVPMVTFACVMIPRAVYEELGGLDETYRSGFEDCDFCLRAKRAGKRIVYTPASVIYHYGQSTPGRKETDNQNWALFRERWSASVEKNFVDITEADRAYNRQRAASRHRRSRDGVHFAVDFSEGSAFTWATADLIAELARQKVHVSASPVFSIHSGISPENRRLLRSLMRVPARSTFHVKWSHYWPSCMKQPMSGDVNAEFYCTNYRYRGEKSRLDLWTRQVQVSDSRLMPISRFNLDALLDVGIPMDRCAVVPLGYAPEIDRLYPEGRPARGSQGDLHLLVVTNSHDLNRYGTDVLVEALGKAFGPDDPVVLHLKDYGAGSSSEVLTEWIRAQKRFPRIVWHKEFLSKDDLIRLYASMDGLIAPYRGEGFGMKIVDAMALGVPVLMPSYGGPMEFAEEGTYLPLQFREVPVGKCYDWDQSYLGDGATWCEVVVESLVEQLKSLPGRREELSAIGLKARQHVRAGYSWPAVAARFMRHLKGWNAGRLVEVTPRLNPSTLPLSVLIPTKDREPILAKALDGYGRQTAAAGRYEIILINDHGQLDKVRDVVAKHGQGLNIRVIDNLGKGGPASARNLGIKQAQGEIVLITGDDIIPDAGFLDEHLNAHRDFPSDEKAFVGNVLWHPDLVATPFMEYLNGEGGQQFNYEGAKHRRPVPFDRFYTSNVSVKRSFLAQDEFLFSTKFPYAAYEDIELAYRLSLRGMDLRFTGKAVGYHHHDMTPRSFLRRQILVGRMLTLLILRQPSFVPTEHTSFLRALECARGDPALQELVVKSNGADMLESLISLYEQVLGFGPQLGVGSERPIVTRDKTTLKKWFAEDGCLLWEAANELALRVGMAEEWAVNDEERRWARPFAMDLALPTVLKKSSAELDACFMQADGAAMLRIPGFKMLLGIMHKARSMPVVSTLLRKADGTWFVKALKRRVGR